MSPYQVKDLSLDVILLAFNEVATIEDEILSWHRDVLSHFNNAKLIVGEDGSTDGTTEILSRLHNLGIIVHDTSTHRRGYLKALQSTLGRSEADWIFFSDTGNKFRTDDFWKLFNVRHHYDLVSAYRHPRNDQLHRRFLTLIYSFSVRKLFPKHQLRDADSGFRLYSRAVLNYILSQHLIFKDFVTSEISIRALAAGYLHREIAVPYYQRKGKSRGVPTRLILKKSYTAFKALFELKRELSS